MSPMTRAEYDAYIAGPHWRERRLAVMKYRGARCESCGVENAPLQLHHITYERLGRELPEDVRLLCRWCHLREHDFTRDPDVHVGFEWETLNLKSVLTDLTEVYEKGCR